MWNRSACPQTLVLCNPSLYIYAFLMNEPKSLRGHKYQPLKPFGDQVYQMYLSRLNTKAPMSDLNAVYKLAKAVFPMGK